MSEMNEKQNQLAEDYLREGKECYLQNRIQEAMELLIKAKTVAHSVNNKIICSETANVLGVIYAALGSTNASVDYYLEALNYAKSCNHGRIIALCMNNIGSAYQDVGEHVKAVEMFHKCEETMEKYGYLKTDKELPMVTITYLNLMDSFCALGQYEKAAEYAQKVKPYIEMDKEKEYMLSYEVSMSKLKWKMGEHELVKKHMDGLLEYAFENDDTTNYVQDMGAACELLMWMEEYEKWECLLNHMEEYVKRMDNLHFQSFLLEMWLQYYKETKQQDKYMEKCIMFTEMYQKANLVEKRERASAIDTKMAIFKMEDEHKKAEKKYHCDPLTGVGNRTKLRKDYPVFVDAAKKDHTMLGIGMMDIDYFKSVNDTYGHLKGDECLVCVTKILKCVTKKGGDVYRLGGDEFLMLIPQADKGMLEQLACEIQKELHALNIPNENSKVVSEVTLSQGYMCEKTENIGSLKSVIQKADEILYEAKKAGRNRYCIKSE